MAYKNGEYNSSALSETAEATNSADLIVSLLALGEKQRHMELVMQVLKARDGETANGIIATVDYATSKFQSRGGFSALPSTSTGTTVESSDFSYLYQD